MKRRLLLASLALVTLATLAPGPAPAAAGDQPAAMPWSVLSRFGGDANGDGKLEQPGVGLPVGLNQFPVVVRPPPAVCGADGELIWTIVNEPTPSVEPWDLGKDEGCAFLVVVSGEGDHTIRVRTGNDAAQADANVDDRLIVAIGDSIASGEGNPQPGGPNERWLDRPCHRSPVAGFEQAARLLAQGTDHRSITFVSLACSGAEIGEGLLGSFRGVAPSEVDHAYDPQVDRLATIATTRQAAANQPAVDAVLLSVGANDIHFSRVVGECALPIDDCRDRNEVPVSEDLATLPASYDRLGSVLRSDVQGSPVLITEYFDPTRNRHGDFCHFSVGLTSQAEARWAYEALLRPLNAEVSAAAHRNRWHLIDGIADQFATHGYCAGKADTWVRSLSGSELGQHDHLGTLHPNEKGHAAIAGPVALELGKRFGFVVDVEEAAAVDDQGGFLLDWVERIAVVLAIVGLIYVLWPIALINDPTLKSVALAFVKRLRSTVVWAAQTLWRLPHLLRPSRRPDPGKPKEADPGFPGVAVPSTLLELLFALGVLVALGLLALLFAGAVGSIILWVRFWAAGLPADQAVQAVSDGERVMAGTEALAIFAVLGLLAVVLTWGLDRSGQWGRATRRGLVVIGVVEVLTALWIGDFGRRQALWLAAGLVVAALLLHFLIDRLLAVRSDLRGDQPLGSAMHRWLRSLFLHDDERPRLRLIILRSVPVVILLLTVWWSFASHHSDRKLILAGLLAAALCFALGLAKEGTDRRQTDEDEARIAEGIKAMEPARVALATAALISIAVLIIRDETWLAGSALVAALLALACLVVAAASGKRFAPFGVAVLVSVALFGATAAMLRDVDSPDVQPVAAVLTNGRSVCGIFVGESDGHLTIGRVKLDEQGGSRKADRGEGLVFNLEADAVAARSIGPLQPLTRVEDQALRLRQQLVEERGGNKRADSFVSCAPADKPEVVDASWQRDLAERYQPEVVVDRSDGFWPIPVATLFDMQDRRAAACRKVGLGDGGDCVRLTTQGQFPWAGGEGESIEYPAADTNREDQHKLMTDALDSVDPAKTAREYFLAVGDKNGTKPITLQYWFFYSFNFQPLNSTLGFHGGHHEGDFESVGVLLSAKTHKPRYLWMARHDKEGRVFPWDDAALQIVKDHPRVFAARGSHATYENCSRQVRPVEKHGLIDDRPTCTPTRQLHLLPEVTPMTELSRVAWGCWHGVFGHRRGDDVFDPLLHLVSDAPLSPFWQQEFGGVHSEPCSGIPDPGGRDGNGEEVVEESSGVPALLRHRAGRLDPLVDECSDWETPPPTGTYMVACDQDALDAWVKSGFEDPGPAGVRIDNADIERPAVGAISLPALRRNPAGIYFDDWRLTATNPTTVEVFASCRQGDDVVAARFPSVAINPAWPLWVSDRGSELWRLRREDGRTVVEAKPMVVTEKGSRTSDERLACGG